MSDGMSTTRPPTLASTIDPESGSYIRTCGTVRSGAEATLARRYNPPPPAAPVTSSTLLFSSGMQAIWVTLVRAVRLALKRQQARTTEEAEAEAEADEEAKAGDGIPRVVRGLIPSVAYCDVKGHVVRDLHDLFGDDRLQIDTFVAGDTEDLLAKIAAAGRDLAFVHVEAVANPTAVACDWAAVGAALPPQTVFVVDNTFFTGYGWNPWTSPYGSPRVSVVLESCSKHLSAGRHIGGVVHVAATAPLELATGLRQDVRYQGIHVPPDVCEVLVLADGTLEERLAMARVRTEAAVAVLDACPYVTNVAHVLSSRGPPDGFMPDAAPPAVVWFSLSPDTAVAGAPPPPPPPPPVEDVAPEAAAAGAGGVGGPVTKQTVGKKQWRRVWSAAAEVASLPIRTSFGGPEDLLDGWPKVQGRLFWTRLSVGFDGEAAQLADTLQLFLSEWASRMAAASYR